MKILHCCLSNFYIDNYSYQENLLPRYNLKHGNQVEIIASTEIFINNSKLGYCKTGEYYNEDGIKVIRVPYSKVLPQKIMKKVRSYEGVYTLIGQFQPDVIMFHGLVAYELLVVVKYVKEHPGVKLYADCHATYRNSARNFCSKYILHNLIYRFIIKKSLPFIDRVFYLGEEVKELLKQLYGVPETVMEFYPLGGEVLDDAVRQEWRNAEREKLNISPKTFVMMHSGKLDKLKKTELILDALDKLQDRDILLLVAGSIPAEDSILQERIMNNKKVKWLGWLDGESLQRHLCASDVYVQPGSYSITMQNAVCCGLPVLLYPYKDYVALCKENALWVQSADDIVEAIEKLLKDKTLINKLKNASMNVAHNILDYNILASRIER